MKNARMLRIIPLLLLLFSIRCTESKLEKKGFQVNEIRSDEGEEIIDGLPEDTLQFQTQPRGVLLTKDAQHRLTPIFKINYHKKTKKPFVGSCYFHENYSGFGRSQGNNWNYNFMPGFEAAYGYNFVNVAHYNHKTNEENTFFERPVLVKTLYYPAFSKDTLNGLPISRQFHMISVYDEDTNQDGFINVEDLRRFYHLDIEGKNKSHLIPENYSVLSSEYDHANDFMYISARIDENENGQMEYEEPTHIFWVDLKNPENKGFQYRGN